MTTSNNKIRAQEIFNQHLEIASTDGRLFRKTVRDQIMAEFGCSSPASSTYYNNCKKSSPSIEGLGRAPAPKGLRRPGNNKNKIVAQLQDDNECFSVIEIENGNVSRSQSFLMQGDASEEFDYKIRMYPNSKWVMIRGLGPNISDPFKLEIGESEIKHYPLEKVTEEKNYGRNIIMSNVQLMKE